MALVARVQSGTRFEQEQMNFLLGNGFVLDAFRDDKKFAFIEPNVAITQAEAEFSFDDQKQFIFVFVPMPDELAFQLGELDVLPVQFAGDFGFPIFGDAIKFFAEVDFLHEKFFRINRVTKRFVDQSPSTVSTSKNPFAIQDNCRQQTRFLQNDIVVCYICRSNSFPIPIDSRTNTSKSSWRLR